jgi:hypothetical protein
LSNGDVGHPLHFAIRDLQADVVHLLLELRADAGLALSTPGCSELSPLQYARTLADDDEDNDAKRIVDILEKHVKMGERVAENRRFSSLLLLLLLLVHGKDVLPGSENQTADPLRRFYLNTMSP